MDRSSLNAFNQRAAAERNNLFGSPVTYTVTKTGVTYRINAALAGISNKRQLEDGGFMYEHDSICRIPRMGLAFTPVLGDTVTNAVGAVMLVAEVVDHPVNPEWKLGLKASV